MTWHSFFDFSTMAHRHLVIVYTGIWIAQLGYLGWIIRSWIRTPSSRG